MPAYCRKTGKRLKSLMVLVSKGSDTLKLYPMYSGFNVQHKGLLKDDGATGR